MAVFALSFTCIVVITVSDDVAVVPAVGIPAQILQAIVIRYVVVVASKQPGRARSDERLQHERVNRLLIVAAKRNTDMPMAVDFECRQDST